MSPDLLLSILSVDDILINLVLPQTEKAFMLLVGPVPRLLSATFSLLVSCLSLVGRLLVIRRAVISGITLLGLVFVFFFVFLILFSLAFSCV